MTAPSAPSTIEFLMADAMRRLAAAGVETARLDARLMLGHVLDLDAAALLAHGDDPVDAAAAGRFADLVARRERREPLSHVLGRREFWSLDFRVTADTLTPRPDSETLIETALAWARTRAIAEGGEAGAGLRVLDFGTGTGCLLLALLSEWPAATGAGVDISAAALAVARDNARALGLTERARFVESDWGREVVGRFDVIVANPPYIAEEELAALAPEVAAFEPRLALAGGADGLAAYRALSPWLERLLAEDGHIFLEIGHGQAGAVEAILAGSGFDTIGRIPDMAGIVRCLAARRQSSEKS